MTLGRRKEEAKTRLKVIEEEEATITCKLMQVMGGASTYATYRLNDDQVIAIKLKQPMHKASFDVDALKKDYPEIYERYLKNLIWQLLKRQKNSWQKNYLIPACVNAEKPLSIDKVEVKNIPVRSAV